MHGQVHTILRQDNRKYNNIRQLWRSIILHVDDMVICLPPAARDVTKPKEFLHHSRFKPGELHGLLIDWLQSPVPKIFIILILFDPLKYQSTDSTGGSIVTECRLGKWSWTGTKDCFIQPLTSCNLSKQWRPWSDIASAASDLGLLSLPMSQSRLYR